MLLDNKTLDAIIERRISVVFRVWKRPTVKKGGTLKTRKGVLAIENVEIVERSQLTADDLRSAGFSSADEIGQFDRTGEFYRITLSYIGEDPRIAKRLDTNAESLTEVCDKLRKTGDWTHLYLKMIAARPNIHAQILADSVGLEKPKFKARVRRLKELGLTESLRPGYKLSPRGKKVLEMLNQIDK